MTHTICIDCRYLGAHPSGIGELVRGLALNAPRLAPDLRFRLLKSPDRKTALSKEPNAEEVTIAASPNGPATMWLMSQIAPLSDVAVYHGTFNTLPAGLKVKPVTTVPDIMWLTNPEWCDNGPFAGIRRWFFSQGIKRALSKSDLIGVVSEATRNAVAAHSPEAAERLHVTFSGVSRGFRQVPSDPITLAKYDINPGQRFILVVGQNAPYKNHEGAMRAFAKALGRRSDARLVFVQRQGSNNTALETLAHRLGISSQVIFAGRVKKGELTHLYCGATALLHPSFCEGFGNPLAEAMASGCPVITSDTSAMPEVTAGAALYANPNDTKGLASHIENIWNDSLLCESLKAKGLARAKQLSWESFAAANIALYRSLIAES